MYLELDASGANRVSFPDCLISSFVANDCQIIFQSDGIFVEGIGFIAPNAEVQCSISGSVHLRQYADGEWSDLDLSPSVGLREIGEWKASDGSLVISGFEAASGLWAEYKVGNFSMMVTVSRE